MYCKYEFPSGTNAGSNNPILLSMIPMPSHCPPLELIFKVNGLELEQMIVSNNIGFGYTLKIILSLQLLAV